MVPSSNRVRLHVVSCLWKCQPNAKGCFSLSSPNNTPTDIFSYQKVGGSDTRILQFTKICDPDHTFPGSIYLQRLGIISKFVRLVMVTHLFHFIKKD